jgi:hypothetical protein
MTTASTLGNFGVGRFEAALDLLAIALENRMVNIGAT